MRCLKGKLPAAGQDFGRLHETRHGRHQIEPCHPERQGERRLGKNRLEPSEFLRFHTQSIDMVSNGDCSIVDENTATMLNIIGSRIHPYRCMRSQCGAGRDFMTFAPNGDIYPCSQTHRKPNSDSAIFVKSTG